MYSFLRFLTLSLLVAAISAAFMPALHSRQTTASTAKLWGAAPAAVERDAIFSGPSLLERPVVAEPPSKVTRDPTRERKQEGNEAWEVRIYNDGLNTREHVARSLVQVTGLSEVVAYQTMMHAHKNGIAVVGRWAFEVAEMYHEELKKNGIVCDIVPVEENM